MGVFKPHTCARQEETPITGPSLQNINYFKNKLVDGWKH